MASDLPLNVQRFKDVTVINFSAASILDTGLIERMSRELYDLVDQQDRRKLVLDFAEVRFLSSSALGMLLKLRQKTADARGQLMIAGLRDELMKIFKISRLDKLFEFHPSEEKALNAFGITTMG